MPYPSPADEDRNGGCGLIALLAVLLFVACGFSSCAMSAFANGGMTVSEARTDGPIYDLPEDVHQQIVCDRHNREYLLLTTDEGGVYLIPYLDENGKQEIMPQA